MTESSFLKEANALQKKLSFYRRWLHKNAETGFDLNKTLLFVKTQLEKAGCAPKPCGRAGLLVSIGTARKNANKTFLLRADMDALPIREETELPFASRNGNMHACGHDMHTAMLLGAATLLKKHEKELCGRVTLLFQPAEELLEGAKDILGSGALDDPKPHAAMMLHVLTDTQLPTGTILLPPPGVSAPAADFFEVRVRGKACHGSAPQNGVDALSAAAHILVALQEVSAREIPAGEGAVLTVGKMQAAAATGPQRGPLPASSTPQTAV